MFAFEWLRIGCGALSPPRFAAALAGNSARPPLEFVSEQFQAAMHWPDRPQRKFATWQPVTVGPLLVLFSGHLDHPPLTELDESGADWSDPQVLARLYAKARLQWGKAADRRLIGEYAAVEFNQAVQTLRLVRSPLRAPPLQFHECEDRVIAASVPRAIHAAGLPKRLNETKLADHGLFNFSDPASAWYEGIERVPLGTEVVITPADRRTRRIYDLRQVAPVRLGSDAEYLEAAHHLLDEAIKAALHGSERPAVMLSGGLDSSQVAAKAMTLLPVGHKLRSYTFTVEPEWDGFVYPGQFGAERPYVEAFARCHPQLAPTFIDNAGNGFDTGLAEMHFATGSGAVNQTNFAQFHALWRASKADGCDRILMADFGNYTFSAEGSWAPLEFFLKGQWRQLWLALQDDQISDRPMWWRFISHVLAPFLPDGVFQWQRRVRGIPDVFALGSPLKLEFAESSGARDRARRAGLPRRRLSIRHRWDDISAIQDEDLGEHSDLLHGFEQIYGIAQRDPTAYRPFAEFCFGLPTRFFLRDGQTRWLAREMARGIMPEAQRLNRAHGRHNADWHVKLGRQRESLLAEIDRMATNPRLAAMFDFARVRSALQDWPATGALPHERRVPLEVATSRVIAMARFVAFVEGHNR